MKRATKRWLLVLLLSGPLLLGLLALAFFTWERPPQWRDESPDLPAAEEPLPTPEPETAPVGARGRRPGVYTLLLAGSDDGNGNTDALLLCCLDTRAHSLNVVSLPRDTLLNIDWNIRKLNAVYAGEINSGGVGLERLRRELRKLTGYGVDACAVVDLRVFMEAVDKVGGVDFEVPQDMDYDDSAQDLHIHLRAGAQHLDGAGAMQLVRFRAGYVNGDLDRLAVQQRFLKEALRQMIQLGTVPQLPELVTLLTERCDTDLTAANVAWLARQTLLCRGEDLHFYTLPTRSATVHELSGGGAGRLARAAQRVLQPLFPGHRPGKPGSDLYGKRRAARHDGHAARRLVLPLNARALRRRKPCAILRRRRGHTPHEIQNADSAPRRLPVAAERLRPDHGRRRPGARPGVGQRSDARARFRPRDRSLPVLLFPLSPRGGL